MLQIKLKDLLSSIGDLIVETHNKRKERIDLEDDIRKLTLNNGKIQQSLLSINHWIAVATVVGTIIAFLTLVSSILKNFHWIGLIEFWTFVLIFFLGTIAGIIIYKLISGPKE